MRTYFLRPSRNARTMVLGICGYPSRAYDDRKRSIRRSLNGDIVDQCVAMVDPVIRFFNRGIDAPVSLFGLEPCAVSCGVPYGEADPLFVGGVEGDSEVFCAEGCCVG